VIICKTKLASDKTLLLEAKTKAITKLINVAEALKREIADIT